MAGEMIFGIEPLFSIRADSVQKHDMLLISDGSARPSVELVQEPAVYDPEDESYVLIKLVSQQTLRVHYSTRVSVARKGMNTNQV